MNEPTKHDDFAAQARRAFDESVERLDGAALSRLNQGRHHALEKLNDPASSVWRRWAPVGGMAAIVLVSVLVLRGPEIDGIPAEAAVDLEILLEGESLEMFQDLEFYSWMDEDELGANGNVG